MSMPVDTAIYGNLIAAPKSVGDYINQFDQADLQRTQLAQQKLNLIGAQQAQADQQAVRALYQRPGFDPATPEGLTALGQVSPSTYLSTKKAMLDNQKTQAEIGHANAQTDQQLASAQKLKTEHAIAVQAQIAQAAGAATDQASWDRGLQIAQTLGADISQVPKVFDPVTAKQIHDQALTGAQQLEAHFKQLTADETVRHNKQTEANTVRGQDVQANTSRSNNAATIAKDYKINGLDQNGNFVGFGDLPTAPAPAPVAAPADAGGGRGQINPGMPGAPTGAAPAPTKPSSPYAALVDSIGTYGLKAETALARTPPMVKSAIMDQVRAKYPDYDPMNFAERQSTIHSFAPNGNNGKTVQALNVAVDHLATFKDLAKALNNGDNRLFNQVGNTISQWTGNAAPNNFESAKNIVMDEVTKGVIGNAGGQGDREKMAAVVSKASSPADLMGAIDTITHLMGGRLQGVEQSYKAGTGGRSDFSQKYLTANARTALESHSGTGAASAAPTQIKDDAGYNALPSGAVFIGPDGKTRRKP